MTLAVAAGPVWAQDISIDNGAHEIVDGDNGGTPLPTQPSPWTIGGALDVGDSAAGALTIRNGGVVDVGNRIRIGDNAGASGTVTVTGDGSTGASRNGLTVGADGDGTLNVENGGTVNAGNTILIGNRAGSTGTVTVTGDGSSLHSPSNLQVGDGGTGTLRVENGGTVSSSFSITAGANSGGAKGDILVTGAGSTLTASTYLMLGHIGTGELTVADGAMVSAPEVYMGGHPTGAGAGSGTLTLSGTNGARGVLETGYIVEGLGTASIGFDGGILRSTGNEADFLRNFDAGDVTIDAGGVFIDSNGFDIGIGTDLQGDGGLTKIGAGTLTLTGANSYSGGTAINDGILSVSTDDQLGDVSGGLTFDGGTLQNTAVFTTSRNITLEAGGGTFQTDADLDLNGVVSGIGGLTKIGSGTLTLNATNSYSGGTTVGSGTLQAGATGAFVDNTPYIVNGGTLDLGGHALTVSSLSGIGGTVAIGAANLTVNQDDNTSFGGTISGDGGLTKIGSGTFTLNGVNTYTGITTVSEGTLIVGGDGHSDAEIAGGVNVESGGTLGGSGTIGGDVDVSGILSAGNSPGTLTITGNLTLNGSSTSVFELNTPGVVGGSGASGNDLVDVGGDLALDGTLDAHVAAAGYYRLFDYNGTRTGTFDSGTLTGTGGFTPIAPDSPDIRYDIPHQVNLSVLGANQAMQFWDGGDAIGDGIVTGGAGTWTATGTNWTGKPGQANINGTWGGSVGVFAGDSGGAVTVDGTQSFDTLQFKTNGYMLTGGTLALDPASGTAGTLSVDSGVSTTIASVIADGSTANALRKVGPGTLKLTGINSYTGGTQLQGGVLSVSDDANLGHEDGTLTFNGGTLQNTIGFTTARDITLEAGGGTFRTDANLTASGTISGDGGLTKTGSQDLHLAGANAYSGGTTIVDGNIFAEVTGALGTGAVKVGSGAALGFRGSASAGDLALTADGGSIVFDVSSSAGTAIIVNEAGTVSFHSNSTADSATIVNNAGGKVDISDLTARPSIAIGSLSGNGDVYLGAKSLTLGGLDRNDTIGGAINDGGFAGGTGGSLVKTGTGTLTLNGVNTYTGLTTVSGGRLVVGDAAHPDASLAGGVKVNAGGTLGGVGTVGDTTIASGGMHAPGNSPGTQTINGDYANHGTLLVEVTPVLSDRLTVNGGVDIAGATLELLLSPASAADWNIDNGPYTIIANDGTDAVNGTFDPVTKNLLFLDKSLDYAGGDGNDVTLELTRNDVGFADVGRTPNQKATAGGIDTLPMGNALWKAITTQGDEDATRAAFDMLSGEIYASTKSALIEDSHFVRDAVNDRIRSAFGDATGADMPVMAYGPGGVLPAAADSIGPVAWGYAFGSWGSFDGDSNAASMDTATGGFLTGIDGAVAQNIRLGLLAGYSHSSFDVDDRASSGSSDNYHLGLYAGGKWDALRLTGGLAYTWHDIETSRSVVFPGFSDSLDGDYNAGTFQAFGEAGYKIDTGNGFAFEPFANLAYVSLHTDGFTEKGGAAALHVHGATTDTTFTTLGVHLSSAFALGGMKAKVHGTLGWRHAYGDTTPFSTHAFAGGSTFDIAGVPIAEDAAIVEAGLDLDITKAATFGLSYQGQIASDARQHGFKATLQMKF